MSRDKPLVSSPGSAPGALEEVIAIEVNSNNLNEFAAYFLTHGKISSNLTWSC
jgi:hypothetical protein